MVIKKGGRSPKLLEAEASRRYSHTDLDNAAVATFHPEQTPRHVYTICGQPLTCIKDWGNNRHVGSYVVAWLLKYYSRGTGGSVRLAGQLTSV